MLTLRTKHLVHSVLTREELEKEDDTPFVPIKFDDLLVIERISRAKFSVYLAKSTTNHKFYAMKIFPFEGDELNQFYLNEIRFADLQHPNIVVSSKHQDELPTSNNMKISVLVTPFVPHNEFLMQL